MYPDSGGGRYTAGKAEDIVKPGDVVKVKVLSVDPEAKRMSLSIKAALPEEEQAEAAPEAIVEPVESTEPAVEAATEEATDNAEN